MKKNARLLLILAAALGATAAAACSLFVDTDDLGGEGAGGGVDANSTDALTSEVGGPFTDGGGGSDVAVGDAKPTCTSTFCDDFDDGLPLGQKWTAKEVAVGTTLALDESIVRSAPKSLRARVTVTNLPDYYRAVLEKNLGPGKSISCTFDWYIAEKPVSGVSDVFGLRTSAVGLQKYELLFGLHGDGTTTFREDVYFDGGGCDCPRIALSPSAPPANQWTRAKFETDFIRASLSYDGVVIVDQPFSGLSPTGDLTIIVGAGAYAGSPVDYFVDNVVCDVKQ